MESPASWTQAEWIVHEAIRKAEQGHAEGRIGLSTTRQITDALREAGLLADDLPALGVFSPPEPEPCPYTFAHTRHWCGNEGCRDS